MSLRFQLNASKRLVRIQQWGHIILAILSVGILPWFAALVSLALLAYSYQRCRLQAQTIIDTLVIQGMRWLRYQNKHCHIAKDSYIQPYLCVLHIYWEADAKEAPWFWSVPDNAVETHVHELTWHYRDVFYALKAWLYPRFAYKHHYLILLPDMFQQKQDFQSLYRFLQVQFKPMN